jgi:hypothetical protein
MVHVVGLDAGNSDATLTWNHSSEHTIPAAIGTGSLLELFRVRSAAGSEKLAAGEYILEHNGQTFFVGQLALNESSDATTGRGDVARYWNGHSLRLLLVLAAAAGLDTVRVVTGLPVDIWTPENKRAVQESLQGTHNYRISTPEGKMVERVLVVDSVGVVMEGAAVLAQLPRISNDLEYAVIDIGEYSTDCFYSRGARPIARMCRGFPVGVGKVADLIRRSVQDATGRELSPLELRRLLRSYVALQEPPAFFHRGHTVHINGEIKAAVSQVGAEIVQEIGRGWGSGRAGDIAASASRVVVIGGGVYYFQEQIRSAIPHADTWNRPNTANADSYLVIARAATDENWNRNRV